MLKNNERIVFMGTPEFALTSLTVMLEAGLNIVGVVTAPDKPAGRGMKVQQSAVKQFAEARGLPTLQPEKLKAASFIEALRALNADLQVVVAFRMLPEVVWNMPPLGTINLHGSLLPQYRGAAPINWAVINGEKETGVTTFKLQHEIDTGDILLQERMPIGENETAGEVHDRMKEIGANLLVETVKGILAGTLAEKPQEALVQDTKGDAAHPGIILHKAPKIFTETCKIDWNQPVDAVHNLVRGLSPFPGAFTGFQNKMLKIYRTEKEYVFHDNEPGTWLTDEKRYLKFACTNGFLHIKQLQLEGKKRMLVEDFLRGFKFDAS